MERKLESIYAACASISEESNRNLRFIIILLFSFIYAPELWTKGYFFNKSRFVIRQCKIYICICIWVESLLHAIVFKNVLKKNTFF